MSSAESRPPDDAAECDVVVVSYKQRERLLACLASIAAASPRARLIVVDNDSDDGSAAAAGKQFPAADVVALDRNVGFAAAVNKGVARGHAPFVLLLNNDARLRVGALEAMVAALAEDGVGAAGPRLLGPAGETELSVGRTLSPWNEAYFRALEAAYRDGTGPAAERIRRRYDRSGDVSSLTGACLLLRRDAFEKVGGFDERFFLYAEDVDLCRRLRRAGFRLRYVAEAVVEHDRGASGAVVPAVTALHYRRSQIAYYDKHFGVLATWSLRLYLALRFATKRLLARNAADRQLAGDLLGVTLRWPGE